MKPEGGTRKSPADFKMSARDLIMGEAELDDEEADESFDEETGEIRRKPNGTNGVNGVNTHLDDSSEEDDDEDDEEAARLVTTPCPTQGSQRGLSTDPKTPNL